MSLIGLAIATLVMVSGGQLVSSGESTNWSPGIVETFLSSARHPVVQRRTIATLEGHNGTKVAFRAISVVDSDTQSLSARGVEIELNSNRTVTTYIDDDRDTVSGADNLRDFATLLNSLHDEQGGAAIGRTQTTENGRTAAARNRPGGQVNYCCPRFVSLNAGIYHRDGESGIVLNTAARPARASMMWALSLGVTLG
jgi:hypothetical protein